MQTQTAMPNISTRRFAKNGYSLLELLVSVSIIALLFSVGFASYRDYQRRQLTESALRLIKSDLRLAQEYAIAGKKPDSTPDNACETSDLQGYRFNRLTATTYRVEAVCSAGSHIVKGPVTLPTNTQLNAIPGGSTFSFRVLGMGIDRASAVTLTIANTLTGTTSQISISTSGEIK